MTYTDKFVSRMRRKLTCESYLLGCAQIAAAIEKLWAEGTEFCPRDVDGLFGERLVMLGARWNALDEMRRTQMKERKRGEPGKVSRLVTNKRTVKVQKDSTAITTASTAAKKLGLA